MPDAKWAGMRRWSRILLLFGLLGACSAQLTAAGFLRVPLVAVDSRGAAVSGIGGDSIEVYANGRRVENFILEKRTEGSSTPTRRTVFLIFDTLSTTHLWLSRAKIIAEQLLDSSGPGIDYLLLSLEPGSGLRYLLGPSGDRREVIRALRKKIATRHPGSTLDSSPRRIDRDDGLLVGDPRSPRPQLGETRTERDPFSAKQTQLNEQEKGELFLSSLTTLNVALTGFNDSVKTVYLFSGGIASRTRYQDLSTTNPNLHGEVQTVDNLFLNSLAGLSDVFKTRGAVFFVVNPAGAQIGREEPGSGENQLRLLAEKGGGRYLEGEPETIVRQLTEMENAFFEVVLPLDGLGSGPIDIEIKPKDPALQLHYGRRAFPSRGFEQLSRDEKMRLALDAAEGGYASGMVLRLRTAELIAKSEDRVRTVYRLKLPDGFSGFPLEVFRVWLGKGGRGAIVELERLEPVGDELSLPVVKKKGYRIRVVIVEPRSAAALIVP